MCKSDLGPVSRYARIVERRPVLPGRRPADNVQNLNPCQETQHMSKSTRNNGSKWTPAQEKQLATLAKQNTPTRVIGLKLGRSEDAIRTKASQEGVSLKPTNQSPYNRRKG
jgi:hypothetical protein